MNSSFKLEIVTPEKMLVNDEATEMQVPGTSGYIGVLPGHAPLITELSAGRVAYRRVNGEVKHLAVGWGFAEVLPEKVTILAELAERAEDLSLGDLRKQRDQAQHKLQAAANEPDTGKLKSDYEWAQARVEAAERMNGQLANLVP
jgi:F-type H+-transporting ATPase subunit epsilon